MRKILFIRKLLISILLAFSLSNILNAKVIIDLNATIPNDGISGEDYDLFYNETTNELTLNITDANNSFNLKSNTTCKVLVNVSNSKTTLIVDENVNKFYLWLQRGSNVTIKSSNSTDGKVGFRRIQVDDNSYLKFESDIYCERNNFEGASDIVSFDENSTLDISDKTLSIVDNASDPSGQIGIGSISAPTIVADKGGKILIHSLHEFPVYSGNGSLPIKSFKTRDSNEDDLGFLSVMYRTGETPTNGKLLLVENGKDVSSPVAEFQGNGTYKCFSALLPASDDNSIGYNLYIDGAKMEGYIGDNYGSSSSEKTDVFTPEPTTEKIVFDLNKQPQAFDITGVSTDIFKVNMFYSNDIWNYEIKINDINDRFNGTLTGTNNRKIWINNGIVEESKPIADITLDKLSLQNVISPGAVEICENTLVNLHLKGNNVIFAEKFPFMADENSECYIDNMTDENVIALYGYESIVNNGKITNLIEWVWDSFLPENTEIKLVFEDKTEKIFKSPGKFKSFAVNTKGPVELYINGKKQKGYWDSSEYTKFKTTENNEFVSYTSVKNYEESSVIEAKLKLEKEGEGELKATYFTANSESPEDKTEHILYADTVTTITPKKITVTATPSENYELEKLVTVNGDNEQVIPDVVAGQSFSYNVASNTTLKAYFKKKELAYVEVKYNITNNKGIIGISFNDKLPASYSEIPAGVSEIKVVAKPLFGFKLSDDIYITENDKTVGVSDGSSYKLKGSGSIVIAATFVEDGSEEVKEELNKAPEVDNNEPEVVVNTPTVVANSNDFSNVSDEQNVIIISKSVTEDAEVKSYIDAIKEEQGTSISSSNTVIYDITPVIVSSDAVVGKAEVSAQDGVTLALPYPEGLSASDLESVDVYHIMDNGGVEKLTATMEENYIAVEGVSSFSPFVLVYEEKETVTPPVEVTYHNLNIIKSEGAKLVSRHDKKRTPNGGSFTLSLEKEEGYEECEPTVYVKRGRFDDWKELKLDEVSGYYQIRGVYTDIYVKVSGDGIWPVSNEDIETQEVKVYVQNGAIVVTTPSAMDVQIFSMTGVQVAADKVSGQREFHNLSEGVYIVKVLDKIIKVKL